MGHRKRLLRVSRVGCLLIAEGLAAEESPLFRTVDRSRNLTANRMHRNDVLGMIKRRAGRAGISTKISPHTFRATGITIYLDEGGDLETAQAIAAHESPRTTKLYDRTSDAIDLAEIERIRV